MLKTRSGRVIKENSAFLKKQAESAEKKLLYKQIKVILDKAESQRNASEHQLLSNFPYIVRQVDSLAKKHLTTKEHNSIFIDPEQNVREKCKQLADLIRESKSCIVYTGAGISTSASIPDYRGPSGVWTMLAKGVNLSCPDFAKVKPTYSHMALSALVKAGLVKHVVSQNCDGLHLRSQIDREKLSELHGNCFVELCIECDCEYIRLFDVTEDSAFRKHATSRVCYKCGDQLRDSIIHFGERLRNGPAYNWERARDSVKNTDLIICIGSSLKVLKHYKCLWPKRSSSVRICIVNIQWTPKDSQAHLKINSYCDDVFRQLIACLSDLSIQVPEYSLKQDPLFILCTNLSKNELNTTNKFILSIDNSSNSNENDKEKSVTRERTDGLDLGETKISTNSWISQSFKKKKKN